MDLQSTKNINLLLGAIIGIALISFLFFYGLQDQKDPLWEELNLIFEENHQTLAQSADSLQITFDHFHKEMATDHEALSLLSKPFLPDMEFQKFQHYFNLVRKKKFTIFSGVTGSGTSTLTEKLASFIAIEPDRIMGIVCAPQFDLEYNKKYIGVQKGKHFEKGDLLRFFDRSLENPTENFVVIIDNFDKINPETFFGPELWRKLDNRDQELKMGDQIITIPDNLYVFSVTHSGVGSKIELNNEHFKRLGGQHFIQPNHKELSLYLFGKKEACHSNPNDKNCTALLDTSYLKGFLYFFIKSNKMIEKKYSRGHTLGQWGNIRKAYKNKDFVEIQRIFINHVNAFKNQEALRDKDFAAIHHTIQTDGFLKNSNFISRQLKVLEEKGFLTEFVVGLSFLVITALFSFIFFKRRQKYIRSHIQAIHQLVDQYDQGKLDYDVVTQNIEVVKKEVDLLIVDNKLNYNEATFFYTFIEDRLRRIEAARNVGQNFKALMDSFLEDQVLSEQEYKKLLNYLDTIKHKISNEDYQGFRKEVNLVYRKYREKRF